MKESEIRSMNRSFGILEERRQKIIDNERTTQLQEHVKKIREHSIGDIDKLVEKGKARLEDNDIEVVYAENSEEAQKAVYEIVKDHKMVAKSKSNTIGEIGLNEFLEARGVEVLETDLGDRIVQLDPDSRPSHPIGPASHLRIEDIARILSKEFNVDVKPEPRAILELVKKDVLSKLSKCSVGITGANSLAADDGSIVTVHNEGNISMVSMLDTHIVVVGIDKLVETIEDAVSVVKLETIFATGKTIPAYINVISSPSKTADIEQILLKNMYGARRVVVILLDNGRHRVIEENAECLMCIGCGSCIVTCPVYTVLGYEFGYKRHLGGKGVFLSNFIADKTTCYESGLYKCTLCELCTVECPLGIKTSRLIESLRNESVKSNLYPAEHESIKNSINKHGSPFNGDHEKNKH